MDGVNQLIESVRRIIRKEIKAYDTAATVRRIEGNTAWVHIDGGVDETPVKLTINAQPGDSVQVRVSGGKAFLVGNGSAPPTDDRVANYARSIATTAQTTAEGAQEAAEAVTGIATAASNNASTAITLAEGIDDHFWSDSAGAHITEDTQEDYLDDPSAAGGNTLITSAGMAIRHGTTQLAAFTSSGAQIGQNANGQTRSVLSTGGMQITQKTSGGVDVSIANLGYGPGTDSGGSTSNAPYYTLGTRSGTIGNYSISEGDNTEASGYTSHAEGYDTLASGYASHAEGRKTVASGDWSHATGNQTTAAGQCSSAGGLLTETHGEGSFSNGCYNYVGKSSVSTYLRGLSATVLGIHNKSSKCGQVVIGVANKEDTTYNTQDWGSTSLLDVGQYAFIIGNGTLSNVSPVDQPQTRSNALTVDWSGNVEAAGGVDIGAGKKYKIGGVNLGQEYTNTKNETNITANNTSLGANVSLPAGVYSVTGEWHYTSTGSSACSIGIALGTSSAQENISEQRIYQPSAWYQTLNTSMTITLSASTTIYVRGFCSIARSGCWSQIKAVRIA